MQKRARRTGLPDDGDCLAGGGLMGELMRSLDWSATSIGPVESWSPTLRTMVRLILANRLQMFLWWGPGFCQIYNDAACRALGAKHPRSMGQPAAECWAEIWHIIGPLIETPFNGGEATWMADIFLEINRKGFTEETHWTIAYSPVPDDTAPGGIGGVIGTVNEITEKVVGERRIVLLRDLGARSSEAKSREEACAIAAESLDQHREDVPFGLIYLIGDDGSVALAGAAGITETDAAQWRTIDLNAAESGEQPWPLATAIRSETMQIVDDLPGKLASVPPGPWSDPSSLAVVSPIRSNTAHRLAGVLVLGVSARLVFDDHYRGFCELLTSQVATAIANARAYEEERRRAEALAEIDRAKTAFFSNVSHEFRTPLTLMLGPIEDMMARAQSDEAVSVGREELDLVHRNSLRLLKLVNTLLDFSRIEAGRMHAAFESVDLAEFTAELAGVFRSAIEKAGLRFIVECERLGRPVHVDRSMWEKIVLNLLSNALKFTFEGEIELTLRRAGEGVELSVRDTGTGIAEHELPRIFERFHRIEGARGRTFEGSGIGLALVQELAKLHHGGVRAQSSPGAGSRFTVRIPFGEGRAAAADAAHQQPSIDTGARAYVGEALRWLPLRAAEPDSHMTQRSRQTAPRILLADDNADLRHYVQRLLGRSYRVETAGDGEAALAAACADPPDLVITDVMMPRLDGFGLLKALRDDPRTFDVPVIMLSARAGEESRVDGLSAGANDYLIKPFSALELIARVDSALATSQANRATVQLERSMRKTAEDAQARTREELASELEAMRRLHELSTRLLAETELQPLLEEVLTATIELQTADFGNVQLYNAQNRTLELVAHRGFDPEVVGRFMAVNENTPTSCGRALKFRRRVIIEDVLTDPEYEPFRLFAAEAGYRAQQSTPLFSRGGELLGMISTHFIRPHHPLEHELRLTDLYARHVADALERKRAEESVRASEERFRRYFDLGLIGMAITSATKGIVEVNDELCNILGYARHELLKKTWAEMTHPDDLAADVAQFTRVLNGEVDGYSLDKRWIRNDGRVIHSIMAARCVRRADGTVDYFIGLVQDITDRKSAQENLAASERRFRTLIESIPHHVWSFRRDGSLGYWNQRLADYTGLTAEQLRSGGWDALHPDDVERVQAAWRDAYAQGSEYQMEQRVRGRDGRYRRFVCRAVPVKNESGETVEWFGTDTDVEDRQRAEEELAEARFDLARVMRVMTMGELVASIAHEINQPLAAIATNGDACMRWLGAQPPNLHEAGESVARIVRDAHRAADVITRIRGFLKRQPTQRCPTDVADAIDEAVALVKGEIRSHGVSLTIAPSRELPHAMVDRVQLQQVMVNLVMNAIDSMGAVSAGARALRIAATRHDGSMLAVSVRDSGTGIDPEHRNRIFEAFYTSKASGMGMGLAISRSIVEAHGGRLWATANDGPGTTFQFTLPVVEAPASH